MLASDCRAPATKFIVTCTQFHPWARNTLVGFASIEIAEIGLIVHDVAGHQKGEARWAQLPAKPQARDRQYDRMMNFGSSIVRVRLSSGPCSSTRQVRSRVARHE